MSRVPVVQRRVEVDDNFLPHPATKLVVTQYLQRQDNSRWAWIIVGTFFNSQGLALWSTEIFIARLDVDSEPGFRDDYDDDDDYDYYDYHDHYDESESTATSYHGFRQDSWSGTELTEEIEDWTENIYSEPTYRQPPPPGFLYPTPSIVSYVPPTWDPVAHIPVFGYWQTRFDPDSRRWIDIWQPQY